MTEHPEHIKRLIDAAFGDLTLEYREHLLAEIALSEPEVAQYGWFACLPTPVRAKWNHLDVGQRLVAFLCASDRQKEDAL